ncbi:MAG: nuclear transport factor 2 family protein [Nevskia sp.]|nr:nuclear transport factor 2 family protein [Nevskia sp.]
MNAASIRQAEADCERLCLDYCAHADAPRPDEVAQLYTPDGEFDRVGQVFKGREAIRALIAGRPPGVWTRHECSNIRIEVGADGRTASGHCDLLMQRGKAGVEGHETIRGEYFDEFEQTAEGWRFSSRKVILKP